MNARQQRQARAGLLASLTFGLLVGLVGCVTVSATPTPALPQPAAPTVGPAEPDAVALAKDDLAQRLGIPANDIKTRSFEAVNWPDASLGCPQPDMMYAQVVTPGYRIVLEARGQTYTYHTGGTTVVLCQPQSK